MWKETQSQLAWSYQSAGELIPWTTSQQFDVDNFAQLSCYIQRLIGRLLGGVLWRDRGVGLAVNLIGDVVRGFHSWMKSAGNANGNDNDNNNAKTLCKIKKQSITQFREYKK